MLRITIVAAGVIALLVAFGGVVLAQAGWPDAIVKKITGEELKAWKDQSKRFVLLDNRVATDYDKEHIPGALRLAPDDLMPNPKLADRFSKDDVIVNYCNGVKCWRSSGAMVLLQSLGFKNLYWYRDGIPDWVKKDYPTVEGKK